MGADYDLYAGISGIPMAEDRYDLGGGLSLERTFTHLMGSFFMAFSAPKEPGQHHPGPWKSVPGATSFDVIAELRVPYELPAAVGTQMDVARMVMMLLRLGVHPGIGSPVVANYPLASMPQRPDTEIWLRANEQLPRFFSVVSDATTITPEHAAWLAKTWPVAIKLHQENQDFALAMQALDGSHFIYNSALALVSLWAALEALFSPSTSELKFRVSALIAAFLEKPGPTRYELQQSVAKLYDKRSAAAHGKPKHEDADLLATMNLVVHVLVKMLADGKVPRKGDLERSLFGG